MNRIYPQYASMSPGKGGGAYRAGSMVSRFFYDVVLDVERHTGDPLSLSIANLGMSVEIWRRNTNVISAGFVEATIRCPALQTGTTESHILVRSLAVASALQARIDQDFKVNGPRADYLMSVMFGSGFWSHMQPTTPGGWNPVRDLARAEQWISDRMREWRAYIQNAREFNMDKDATGHFVNPQVEAFFTILRGLPAGFVFPATNSLVTYKQAAQAQLIDGWFAMWRDLLAAHDADTDVFNRGIRGTRERLIRQQSIILRAIIYNWPSGRRRTEQTSLDILAHHYTRLPAFTQLTMDALDRGFGVLDRTPIADATGNRIIDGWCYARVLYASPDGTIREFMVRFRPDTDLDASWGNGFMAFASGTMVQGGTARWEATQPVSGSISGDPVSLLYNIITGINPIPLDPHTGAPFTSLAAYLDTLSQVQIGGHQASALPNKPPTTLPHLY
ncbi:MAG: hypothetical protein GYA24_19170 [Candidatus Lokiarchaeota archaeon]|nr:hypothetical protein [Candidatus Lokiarchaeota archaeon]